MAFKWVEKTQNRGFVHLAKRLDHLLQFVPMLVKTPPCPRGRTPPIKSAHKNLKKNLWRVFVGRDLLANSQCVSKSC